MRQQPTDIELDRFKRWKESGTTLAPSPESPVAKSATPDEDIPLDSVKTDYFPPAYVSPTESMPEPEWLRTTGEVMGAIVGAPIKFAISLPGAVTSSINNAWNLYAHVVAGGKFVDPENGRELSYTQAMDPKEASETLRTSIGMANLDLATIPFGGGVGSAGEGLASGPKFYSPLERALETGKVGKLSIPDNPKATGMLSTFKYATDKNLINAEELEYTGLLQKLKSLGDARISREEMLEVVKGKSLKETGTPDVLDTTDKNPNYRRFLDRADSLLGLLDEEITDAARAGNSVLERRLLDRRRVVERGYRRVSQKFQELPSNLSAKYGSDSGYSGFNLPGHVPGTYQERLFHFTPEGGLRYVEPHDWPGNVAENAFMFTRGHDRKLPNGETSKHLDEMQSSLHQKAMEEGYADPTPPKYVLRDRETNQTIGEFPTAEEAQLQGKLYYKETGRGAYTYLGAEPQGIPKAPFSDLKWAKLGLKEWVDTAIKEGKDSVTWSTGRIVADRYNKLVNKFEWRKDLKSGKYTLRFETPNGREFEQGYVNMKQLQDNAGKNVARIVEEQEKVAKEFRDKRDIASALTVVKQGDDFYTLVDTVEHENLGTFRTGADAINARNDLIKDYQHPRTIVGDGATGDFLVGGKFFEKVYDEYMVREAEKEYGVRPQKIKTEIEPAFEPKTLIKKLPNGEYGLYDPQFMSFVTDPINTYEAKPISASTKEALLKRLDELGIDVSWPEPRPAKYKEVWHLPLSPELKQRITVEGQRIAQGSLTTAQALKALSQRDEYKRQDGTQKGPGYLGTLQRPDGAVSTELSIGVNFDGKEMEIPTLVPTLTQDEINYLLLAPLNSDNLLKTPVGKRIVNKAVEHAKQRIKQGKSPFAEGVFEETPNKLKIDESTDWDSRPPFESGKASWYGKQFHGKTMSNKQPFNMNKVSAAHRKLPLGTKVKVTDTETGKSINTEITDRGPYIDGRIIDLSKKAAEKLGIKKKGVANVRIEVIQKAKDQPPHIKVENR